MPGLCPKCSKTVYFAEEKIVLGKPYHKICVKCKNCSKLLDSSSFTDHKNEMFCKTCYAKLFGPKGYGYGIGAGVLSMDDGSKYENGPPTSNIPSIAKAYIAPLKVSDDTNNNRPLSKSKYGGGNYCYRCCKSWIHNCSPKVSAKAVFMAEKIMAAGNSWHQACFTCKLCSRRLDSHSLRDRENEVYCNPCYSKNYGPKGYFGWSAGVISREK